MLRVILSAIIILLFCSVLYSEDKKSSPIYKIEAEYRKDTIDYDESEKKFSKEKINLLLSKSSSFNISHLYVDNKENRFTWNITLLDISPYLACIIGNYYINFGAGLLIGKKKAMIPDLFSSKLIISEEKMFLPCNSGNPLFCFNGIAVSLSYRFTDVSISINGFYSINSRYIISNELNNKTTISSINNRIDQDYKYNEPVTINAYGMLIELKLLENFKLQSYYFYTDIKDIVNKNIIWNYNNSMHYLQGEKNIYGYGIFLQYSDDYINIFFEYGIPGKTICSIIGDDKRVSDYGILYGIKFKHPFFSISFTGKNCGKNFYAHYSSGGNYPEATWIFNNSINPLKNLTLGSQFSSEKNLSPGYRDSYLASAKREQVFLRYKFLKKDEFKLSLKRIQREEDIGYAEYVQIKSSIMLYITERIKYSLLGIYQKRDKNSLSGVIGTGLSFPLFHYFRLSLHYARFFASQNNSVYTSISPFNGSITSGSFIKESSNLATARLSLKYKESIFSVKYQHQFQSNKSIKKRLEFFGRLVF